VQQLLKSNTVKRKVKFSESGALLRGNRMGPSFSSKNGVRYRFYVSTALRGRSHSAGSVTRISAPEIEGLVETALTEKLQLPRGKMLDQVETITVSDHRVRVALNPTKGKQRSIDIPWTPKPKGSAVVNSPPTAKVNEKLIKSIIRSHVWLADLSSGRQTSIEALAAKANLHPKVIRQELRLAFVPPDLTKAVLQGEATIEMKRIPKTLPLSWRAQHRSIG
jgi:site-specific DNA recombinase